MTRLSRLNVVSQTHYVVLRSVPEISLIPAEDDISALFRIFSQESQDYSVDISGYAVFTDQVHLLLFPRNSAEDLSKFTQQVSRLYGRYFNDAYARSGKIWQSRYESCLLQGANTALRSTVYFEWLPFILGYGEPQFYPWTSYSHHCGLRSDYFMMPSAEYWALGNTPFERQKRYQSLFEEGPDTEFGELVVKSAKRGWPVAEASFLDSLGIAPERRAPQRGRGRPKKQIDRLK